MFNKQYGDVQIYQDVLPKRGNCLVARRLSQENSDIYMDIVGFALAEGTNVYMYGNKLIVITRWNNIKEDEIETLKKCNIKLCIAPFKMVQFGVAFGNWGWNDVFVTLYHSMSFMNDEDKPVDEAIFIWADKSSGEIVCERTIALEGPLANFLSEANKSSHSVCALDFAREILVEQSKSMDSKDWCDLLCDVLWEYSKETSRKMRSYNLDYVNGGIYVEIDGMNRIINMEQKEFE